MVFCACRLLVLVIAGVIMTQSIVSGQVPDNPQPASHPSRFRLGEKLSYYISYASFENSAYAELFVASIGKLGGVDAVELHSKIKTLDFVSADFSLVDETRVVYASADTGLPLYTKLTQNGIVMPKETINSYLAAPTSNYDLVTLLYKARESGGDGSFTFAEGDQTYVITFRPLGSEKVKTAAGEYDTVISLVQSDYLTQKGIKELKINFTSDDDHIPVLWRCKMAKADFRASLASVQVTEPAAAPSVTPAPASTPRPTATPRPTPTPVVYLDNQPLLPELGFAIGETLDYRVTTGGRPAATISLRAVERKQVQNVDSLLLTATVTSVEPGNRTFRLGDYVRAYVNPDTLAPYSTDAKFGPELAVLNQTVKFDPKTGFITSGTAAAFDAPVGTHTILSLVYAMRSFNLKPSKTASNPVNDTRVAVFWDTRPYVFTLRPAESGEITVNGEKVSAQMISVNTGNPGNAQLDALALKVWLSNGEGRNPLRFSVGAYQLELISSSNSLK